MDFFELIKLSLNALVANKLRSLLTTLGIIIGVFSIILLVSIGSGLQSYITGQISGLGSNLLFVIPGSTSGGRTAGGVVSNKLLLSDSTNLDRRLRNQAFVAPVVSQQANTKFKNKTDNRVSILGTTGNYPSVVKTDLQSGVFFSTSQERSSAKVAVIGQTVLNDLYPGTSPIGSSVTIGSDKYRIVGVLAAKGSVFGIDEDNTIIIPIETAQRQFGITNVNSIYIAAKTSTLVPIVEKEIKTILLERLTEDDFSIETQESTLSTITNITNVLSIALGGIAAISLVVGGIGVANIMLVSVTERTKEIGLRKALGAQKEDILKQFLLEAVILSIGGGAIGICLGLIASVILSKFFVSQVSPVSIIIAFGFSALVGIIFGMIPALRASNLSPIEALRYE